MTEKSYVRWGSNNANYIEQQHILYISRSTKAHATEMTPFLAYMNSAYIFHVSIRGGQLFYLIWANLSASKNLNISIFEKY